MKICPSCNTEYDDATKFCLEDGVRTVDKEQRSKDALIGQFVDKDKQYQAISMLGEGGMGKVYRGRQESMNRDVAIKTLHKELLSKDELTKRFRREALAASKLRHANAIDVYTFGQIEAPGLPHDGMPYMVMEFVSGKSLYRTIHDATRLDEARTIRIMLQVCDVLEEAHRQGIIHRDLKPENIVLTTRGKNEDFVKVLDFGIAKLLQEEEAGATKLTKAGTVFGTPEYLSPEQASGIPVDVRSDIYSLGIILYEMLTGKVPFKSDTAVGLLIKHVNEAPKPIREFAPEASISPSMETIVMRALSKDPKDRQPTVIDLAEALRAIQSGAAKPVLAATFIPGHLPPVIAAQAPRPAPAPMAAPASVVPFSAAPSTPQTTGPQTLSPVVLHQGPQPASGATLAIILLAIFLGGGAAGTYFLYLKDKPQASPAVDPIPTQAALPVTPEVKKITLDIDSSPQGADVIVDGAQIGITPIKWEVLSTNTAVTVIMQEDGFLQFKQTIDPNKDPRIAAKLLEDQTATVAITPPTNTKGNGSKTSKGDSKSTTKTDTTNTKVDNTTKADAGTKTDAPPEKTAEELRKEKIKKQLENRFGP